MMVGKPIYVGKESKNTQNEYPLGILRLFAFSYIVEWH
jgi:hypothetical protein